MRPLAERWKLLGTAAAFALLWWAPLGGLPVPAPVGEGLLLLQEYVREHVVLCLVPAFFIAGGISVFVSQGAVLRYLGARARRVVAYPVAAVSGGVLAVCSCTVLPLFSGIHRRGAGLGPASTFLYAGPAINVLAVILTARVLGPSLGLARAAGAVVFSVVVGLAMAFLFRREEAARAEEGPDPFAAGGEGEGGRRGALLLATLVGLLVFAAWARPREPVGFFEAVFRVKWWLAGGFLLLAVLQGWRSLGREERGAWFGETWTYAKLMLPLLFAGVFASGVLLGRPGTDAGLLPSRWVEGLVGGNSLPANFFAALSGSLMYFATLTEVPILQGLLGSGMGEGPALALLLAGPAVSLPSLLVIRGVLGTRKALAYAGIVVLCSTLAGWLWGGVYGT